MRPSAAPWFSNMLPLDQPFRYQGTSYATVENFYQAMKLPTDAVALRQQIAAMNPFEAKKAIRDASRFHFRADWTPELSLKVMEFALRKKFAPGTSWHAKLLATGQEELSRQEIVEWNNWGDTFWGKDIATHIGQNHLGQLLMAIRDEHNS